MIPASFAKGAARRGHEGYGLGGITRGLEIWKPLIAAINGHCLAGGMEQALACDLRISVPHATFGLPEVRWAIIPGAGGTQRLPRTVSLAKAMEMILMAKTLTAADALEAGLINAVVPAAELMSTARAWAETICERGPLAVRAAKEAVMRGLAMPLPDGLRLEAFLSGTLRGTEDAVEGPKAFRGEAEAQLSGPLGGSGRAEAAPRCGAQPAAPARGEPERPHLGGRAPARDGGTEWVKRTAHSLQQEIGRRTAS
jgi:enoyl-CoA hydratase/carnithine racemase